MQCAQHPDHGARFRCEKHDIQMCERCIACRDPELHCRYREHCLVWRLVKEGYDEEISEE